jgi:L-iditol 2-dehydrogenase
MKMKAALLYGCDDIRVEDVDRPEPGRGEVIVKVEVALTCGTDVKAYHRGYHAMLGPFPSRFGHEFAGVVVAVGEDVADFEAGQRVVAANSAPCNRCFYCRVGQSSLCDDLEFLNGAYAEFIRVPPSIVRQNLLRIPAPLSFRQAAMCEPLACVVHGVEESNVKMGDTVAVIGAGPIGLMLVRLAKLKGARVVVIGRNDAKLESARRLGADEVISIYRNPRPEDAIREMTEGRGVDVAIEAVGRPDIWERTIDITRKGGTVNFFGGCEKGTFVRIDTGKLHYDERRILGVFHHSPRYIATALGLIARDPAGFDGLVTHEHALRDLEEAFRIIDDRQALKIAIIP